MDFALEAGIFCFNVESEPELELLSQRAVAPGKDAPVSLRINPDVDARTHHKISTGKAENKFGIPWITAPASLCPRRRAAGHPRVGIDMHIGSQITDLEPFDNAIALLVELLATCCARTATPSPCRCRRRARHPLSLRRGAAAAAGAAMPRSSTGKHSSRSA
jgi:diaminopimelate decarboxylase